MVDATGAATNALHAKHIILPCMLTERHELGGDAT